MIKSGDIVEMYRFSKNDDPDQLPVRKYVCNVEVLCFGTDFFSASDGLAPFPCVVVQMPDGWLRNVPTELIRATD